MIPTCAVVTTAARGAVAGIHDRMPLVLDGDEHERWLTASVEGARGMLGRGDRLVVVPVSTWVHDVKHDDAHGLEAPEPSPWRPPRRRSAFK